MERAIYNLYDAKTALSQLVERAAAGEEIVIAKAGCPLARLVPLEACGVPSSSRCLEGQGSDRRRVRRSAAARDRCGVRCRRDDDGAG
jgi:prevent-host-death family protein